MAKILFTDKVKINDLPIPEINKLTADNVNEIKNAVNKNVDDISNIKPNQLHPNLFSLLDPVTIRNQELNNEDITGGTRWTITAIDTGAKTITFDNKLPYLTGFNERVTDFDYWGCFVGPTKAVRVEAVNYQTKTITYTDGYGTLAIGNKVTFFNPFRSGRLTSTSPLLGTVGTWGDTHVTPAGVWKHTDGTYRMLVNGLGGGVLTVGIATSTDLETWAYVGTDPIFTAGVAPFNESWMLSGSMFAVSDPVKVADSDNLYYILFTIKNLSGLWETVVCVMDEDANIIEIADDPISITGHANTYGNYAGAITYVNGVYSVFIINRGANLVDWTTYELQMPTPITGNITSVTQVVKGTGTNIWYGSHVDTLGTIIYNDKLYLFVGGTGLSTSTSEIWSSNRQYGIFTKENGVWTDYKANPVLCNPILGQFIWDANLTWASDHVGGYFGSMIKDNYLYVFISMNNGSDTYRVSSFKYNLVK